MKSWLWKVNGGIGFCLGQAYGILIHPFSVRSHSTNSFHLLISYLIFLIINFI